MFLFCKQIFNIYAFFLEQAYIYENLVKISLTAIQKVLENSKLKKIHRNGEKHNEK